MGPREPTQPPAAGAGGAGAVRLYADAPNRVLALLLDAVFLTIIIFVAAIGVSLVIGPAVELDAAAETLDAGVTVDRSVATVDAIVSLVLSATYFVAFWTTRARTPGQRLVRLTVGSQRSGAALSAREASLRWLLLGAPFGVGALLNTAAPGLNALVVDLPIAAWYLVLLVTTVRSPSKQGLHDRIARSVVVKAANPVSWEHRATDAR